MPIPHDGAPFSATAKGTSLAIVTKATTGSAQALYITDVTASTDSTQGTVTVLSGATTIWQNAIYNTSTYTEDFIKPIGGVAGATIQVQSTGTNTFELW